MKIAFYAPFKPLGHRHPSGDLIIATGIYDYLTAKGHRVLPVSPLRARWIYWKPWRWIEVAKEMHRAGRRILRFHPDLWLTYHTYYKAPDLLGPSLCRKNGVPYVIFQGIYSTKRRKKVKTWPGFILNRSALVRASLLFSNRQVDYANLKRIIPENQLAYIAPGIYPEDFQFDKEARRENRRQWGVDADPVILSAAMFRPDVKSEGLSFLIRSCGRLFRRGLKFYLVVAGSGREYDRLLRLAEENLPGRFRFVGKVPRDRMYRFYSAGDLFVFPGIRESLGMVFLEAQSCGLPCVAFHNGGIPEVVHQNKTGMLTPIFDENKFDDTVTRLLEDENLRRSMGRSAWKTVREKHDLNTNYRQLENGLQAVARRFQAGQ